MLLPDWKLLLYGGGMRTCLHWQLRKCQLSVYQSGTKKQKKLVAKILAKNFGVFYVIYVMF